MDGPDAEGRVEGGGTRRSSAGFQEGPEGESPREGPSGGGDIRPSDSPLGDLISGRDCWCGGCARSFGGGGSVRTGGGGRGGGAALGAAATASISVRGAAAHAPVTVGASGDFAGD